MAAISRHNYEAFFLDCLDGNLSEKDKKELKVFLQRNPDLQDELEGIGEIKLQPEQIFYENKQELIKKTQAQYFEITELEYLCIAETESDINYEEKHILNDEIKKNTVAERTLKLFKKTKLLPDYRIKYSSKKELYHKTVKFSLLKTAYSISAAVIILLFFVKGDFLFNQNNYFEKQKSTFTESKTYREKAKPIFSDDEVKENKKAIISKKNKALFTHNQTIKNSNNNVLAFDDNESQNIYNFHYGIKIPIPEMKNETLISNISKSIPVYVNSTPVISAVNYQKKEPLLDKNKMWMYAEKGVKIWKKLTGDDIELRNVYTDDGNIEEINFIASNFQFRKTYAKK